METTESFPNSYKNSRYEHFLLFTQGFQKTCTTADLVWERKGKLDLVWERVNSSTKNILNRVSLHGLRELTWFETFR